MHTFFFLIWSLTLFFLVLNFYFAQSPIESGLCLMLTFAWLALFFLSVNLGFFFSIFIILYVSAIVVLFLFTVLMFPQIRYDLREYFFHALAFLFFFFVLFFFFSYYSCVPHLTLSSFFLYKLIFGKLFFSNLVFLGSFFFINWAFVFIILTILLFFILVALLLIFK